jgi:hypothetical protein
MDKCIKMSRWDLEEEQKKGFIYKIPHAWRWLLYLGIVMTMYCTVGYHVFFNNNPDGWWVGLVCATWLTLVFGKFLKLENPM